MISRLQIKERIIATIDTGNSEDIAERLLSLLDAAYDHAENPHRFDDLFTQADQFFFPQSAMSGLAEDILGAHRSDARLDTHIARIQAMIDRSEAALPSGPRIAPAQQMAILILSDDGIRVTGNAAAATLLHCKFPASLSELGLRASAKAAVRQCLTDLRAGHFEGSTVIAIHHEEHKKPFLAKCTKLQSRDAKGSVTQGLSILINHISWHETSLRFAVDAFGLTPAEAMLLKSLLEGQSYPQAAATLGKSVQTLKAQGKAILRKTGFTQMSEFMALMMGYAFLAEPPGPVPVDPAHPFQTQGPHDIVTVASGRKIQVGRYGRQGGRPLLFFHGLYQGPYLSEELDRAFEAAGFDVFAPSRPGFNRSDPPRHWPDFNTTTTDDVLSVCNHYGLKSVAFIVHQAGISFACRAGKALGPRALAAVMICAGVPIKDYMLKTMNIEARVAGAAVKYAPKVFDLLLRLGIAKWRRQGPHAYLANLFQESAPDRETLSHPARGPIMSKGALHMISQGPPTIIHDARSAMGDWEAEYLGLPHRQLWLHGAQDNVMNPQFVAEFLAAHDQPPPIVYPDRGGDILLAEPLDVVEKIRDFLRT